ncbi:MAG: response regulator transcription factor [Deltaproteobacteria bacterium]|nr:response regulator transcription factor [Deltaproteobacteria bacterium]
MSVDTIGVLIVDDHDLARAGLRGLLEDEPDIDVLGELESGFDVVAAYRTLAPTVVLMDLRMPAFDGIHATAALLREYPDAKVLIISSFGTQEDVFRAHQSGARGYLLKESRRPLILEAVRRVAEGQKFTPPALAELVELHKSRPALTSRDRQILQLLQVGLNNSEIAERLALSPGTVRMYVSRIFEKVGAANRTEAVSLCIRRGLLPPADYV